MKTLIAAFLSAFVFGLGLAISGMTLPAKVIGFLDVTGQWDPSLLAVMFSAIAVHLISYRLISKRQSPLLAEKFQVPTRRDIDWKLVTGSAIFGAGWGLGGYCPGPAFVGLATAQSSVVIFVISMLVGIVIYNVFSRNFVQKKGKL